MQKTEQKAKDKLYEAALDLFVAEGFDAVSVRDICKQAGTTVNMVNYYFGSKQGLYDEILSSLSENVFMTPIRVLDQRPQTQSEFRQLMHVFIDATLDGLIKHRKTYILASRERVNSPSMMEFQNRFIAFIEQAKIDCLVRQEINAAMISGLITGRLASQVIDADWIHEVTGTDITSDNAYRKRWIDANLDIFLHGMLTREQAN